MLKISDCRGSHGPPFAQLIAMFAVILAISLTAESLPLVADHVVTGPQSHVTLTNTARQPITAWAMAVLTHPEPGRTHRDVETVDGYLSELTHGIAGSSERLERLMPGQSRQIAMDPMPPDATVEIVAVILDDGTAMGDEQIVASLFQRRAKERDALGSVSAAFREVLASQHGTAALDALRARLDSLADHQSVPCRAAIEAVDTYKQHAGERTPEQIDESLRNYATFVTREWELAKKHATRKT
jgi:hypothetical protein